MSSCKNKQSIIFSCNSTKRVPKKAHKKPKKKIFPEKLNFSKCEATVTQQKSYPPQPLPHLQALPQPQLPPQQDIFRWEKKQTQTQNNKRRRTSYNNKQSHTRTSFKEKPRPQFIKRLRGESVKHPPSTCHDLTTRLIRLRWGSFPTSTSFLSLEWWEGFSGMF